MESMPLVRLSITLLITLLTKRLSSIYRACQDYLARIKLHSEDRPPSVYMPARMRMPVVARVSCAGCSAHTRALPALSPARCAQQALVQQPLLPRVTQPLHMPLPPPLRPQPHTASSHSASNSLKHTPCARAISSGPPLPPPPRLTCTLRTASSHSSCCSDPGKMLGQLEPVSLK